MTCLYFDSDILPSLL